MEELAKLETPSDSGELEHHQCEKGWNGRQTRPYGVEKQLGQFLKLSLTHMLTCAEVLPHLVHVVLEPVEDDAGRRETTV